MLGIARARKARTAPRAYVGLGLRPRHPKWFKPSVSTPLDNQSGFPQTARAARRTAPPRQQARRSSARATNAAVRGRRGAEALPQNRCGPRTDPRRRALKRAPRGVAVRTDAAEA